MLPETWGAVAVATGMWIIASAALSVATSALGLTAPCGLLRAATRWRVTQL